MANTVWKGRLTFGLVSFPVRLVRAARKDRIPLRYVRQVDQPEMEDGETSTSAPLSHRWPEENEDRPFGPQPQAGTAVEPVRLAYVADEEEPPLPARELQRGYEVAPGQFAVVRAEELRRLRQPTSQSMEILRSVHMEEIDPVFLQTSYFVLPASGGEHSYGLFYRALKESGYAALAELGMHGRQHVVVIRPGAKGLIAHTMYYVTEVRGAEEYAADTKDVAAKELDLARKFVEAIAAPFKPEEFTDRYREQLEALIAAKETVPSRGAQQPGAQAAGKVVDIMNALRKSLENVQARKSERKPAKAAMPSAKSRKRRAERVTTRILAALSAELFLYCVCACGQAADTEPEPAAIVEIGGAAGWSTSSGASSFGPTVAVEVTPIEKWLELEAGITSLFGRRSTEWDADLLFKKPWSLSKKVEFMLGAGPEWVHVRQNSLTANSVAGEAVLDFMFWPSAKRRFGFYLEPGYEYNFGRGHEKSAGMSFGLLIAIQRR